MATITRQFTFVDSGEGRAEQWMSDAQNLWDFIAANVQPTDGTKAFSTAPVLAGGDPATAVQAASNGYMDTKLKLENVFSTDSTGYGYPDPGGGAFTWFWQGGRKSVTTVVFPLEVFNITFPMAYGSYPGSLMPMCWFDLVTTATTAELGDNYVASRTATGFTGVIATGTSRTVDIAWLALGFGLPNWNTIIP